MNKLVNKEKGFTLIELLVVISIVGLLASIVLVNLKGTKGKAEIAKALSFSQSVHNVLGAYSVGDWRLEFSGSDGQDMNNQTVIDSSGYGNNGTSAGTSLAAAGMAGTALNFNGTSDYITVSDGNSLDFDFQNDSITISVWIKTSLKDQRFIIDKMVANRGYHLFLTGSGKVRFMIHYSANAEIIGNTDVADGKWHNIIVGYDASSDKFYLYIDGKSDGTGSATPGYTSENTKNLFIGSMKADTGYFNGIIDEVKIYKEALTAAQIQKLYVEGAERRQLTINQ